MRALDAQRGEFGRVRSSASAVLVQSVAVAGIVDPIQKATLIAASRSNVG
jgi:hypothetical protein